MNRFESEKIKRTDRDSQSTIRRLVSAPARLLSKALGRKRKRSRSSTRYETTDMEKGLKTQTKKYRTGTRTINASANESDLNFPPNELKQSRDERAAGKLGTRQLTLEEAWKKDGRKTKTNERRETTEGKSKKRGKKGHGKKESASAEASEHEESHTARGKAVKERKKRVIPKDQKGDQDPSDWQSAYSSDTRNMSGRSSRAKDHAGKKDRQQNQGQDRSRSARGHGSRKGNRTTEFLAKIEAACRHSRVIKIPANVNIEKLSFSDEKKDTGGQDVQRAREQELREQRKKAKEKDRVQDTLIEEGLEAMFAEPVAFGKAVPPGENPAAGQAGIEDNGERLYAVGAGATADSQGEKGDWNLLNDFEIDWEDETEVMAVRRLSSEGVKACNDSIRNQTTN